MQNIGKIHIASWKNNTRHLSSLDSFIETVALIFESVNLFDCKGVFISKVRYIILEKNTFDKLKIRTLK
jgi:hypothetical protein